MGDADQTILSSKGASGVQGAPPPEPEKPKRNPLVIIGGIGCVLLLCALLFIAGGVYMAGSQLEQLAADLTGEEVATVEVAAPETEATNTPTPSPEPVEEPTDTPTPASADAVDPDADSDVADEEDSDAAPVVTDPAIGAITFALGATEAYEPIDPGTSFDGEITEIHAIFEYEGFSPDFTWERVWFLDDEEMLRSAEPWSGADAGIFDYFINAGGEALSPGEWVLELYVEDELMASGSFTIEGDEEEQTVASATGTANAENESDSSSSSSSSSGTTTPTATATADTTPTPIPRPVSKTYKLAYTKWDGGNHILYIGDTSGGSEQYIMGRAAGPSWTPDGQYIFFYGEEGVDRQVVDGIEYVFDGVTNGIVRVNMAPIPGTIDQVLLYQGPGWNDGTARWANVSPNGQMVAYDARPGGDYRIYFLGTDENQQFKFELIGEQADWSPDSQKVVYRSGRDGKTGIWISNRDDSGHTQITSGGSDSFPAWSPDGKTIVFSRDEGGNVDIYAMNVDGSNVRRLTDAAGPDTLPVFTPDGQIIFRSARSGKWAIWKMNIDGSGQTEIVSDAGVGPDWTYSRMSVLP